MATGCRTAGVVFEHMFDTTRSTVFEPPGRRQTLYASAVATEPAAQPVLRLGVTGRLGHMSLKAALSALRDGVTLLERRTQRILGDRSGDARWLLTGLREGSVEVLTRAEGLAGADSRRVVDDYIRSLRSPASLLDEDVVIVNRMLTALETTDSGSFRATLEGGAPEDVALLEPRVVLPMLVDLDPERHVVVGSVVGRLEGMNVHRRLEAGLYTEGDDRRVVVTFSEALYDEVHAAVRSRVEASGLLTEDVDGRPIRLRLRRLERMDADDDLPTLSALFGAAPDLIGSDSATDYVERSRSEMGLN